LLKNDVLGNIKNEDIKAIHTNKKVNIFIAYLFFFEIEVTVMNLMFYFFSYETLSQLQSQWLL